VLKLLTAKPEFFRGIDLSHNPLFKETSLKTLFMLQKTPNMLEKSCAKLNTRFLTFLSIEKTGITNELTLCSFVKNVFYTCPDLEILIMNSLPITDKVCDTLSKVIHDRSKRKYTLFPLMD
jgi:hypothetical protein